MLSCLSSLLFFNTIVHLPVLSVFSPLPVSFPFFYSLPFFPSIHFLYNLFLRPLIPYSLHHLSVLFPLATPCPASQGHKDDHSAYNTCFLNSYCKTLTVSVEFHHKCFQRGKEMSCQCFLDCFSG